MVDIEKGKKWPKVCVECCLLVKLIIAIVLSVLGVIILVSSSES